MYFRSKGSPEQVMALPEEVCLWESVELPGINVGLQFFKSHTTKSSYNVFLQANAYKFQPSF